MRVTIFHMGFFYSGGGEKLVLHEARELRARGHDVAIFAPIVDEEHCFPELVAELGPRRLVPRLPQGLPYRDGIALLWSAVLADRVTRPLEADVYLGANQPGAHLARRAARRHGRRYVVYLNHPNRLLAARGIDLETRSLVVKRDFFLLDAAASFGRPVMNALDRASVRDAAVRLGDGEYVTSQLRTYYGGEWRSCPAATFPAESEPRYADRMSGTVSVAGQAIAKPYLLLTNRHYPQKRFELALPALEQARKEIPGITLVITGQETVYTDHLRAEIRKRGLGQSVRILGLVSEADLVALYRGAAVYVYPSPEEDFGMGIVEAMGQGTPVVAWRHAGPTGIIEDGVSGALVTPGDSAEYAERVVGLLRDAALRERIGQGAWRRAAGTFSYRAHADILESALREANAAR